MPGKIQLEVRRPNAEPVTFDIDPGVYSVGSDDDCKIRLAHHDVDSRHAILTARDDACWIEDLDAAAGTHVDGKQVWGRVKVDGGQEIGVGPFVLVVRLDAGSASHDLGPTPQKVSGDVLSDPVPIGAPLSDSLETPAYPPGHQDDLPASHADVVEDAGVETDAEFERKRSVKQQIHKELLERLDIKRMSVSRIDRTELREKALGTIGSIVDDVSDRLPQGMDPKELVKEIYDEAVGLGPIEDLLADESVTEIMVNGHNRIYVEKNGKLVRSAKTFMDDSSVLAIIERIVSPIGRRIDESQPYVDARLADGSRVNAIIHPLSLVGPCLTIRKFSKTPFTDKDLMRFGTMTPFMAELIEMCVVLRKNIVVSGGTGSGKTSLLNVLSSYLPSTERIVTIEDAAELRLTQDHVVRLEARPPNIEGRGAVMIRDLVRNALRMRPDRIVVGECRGGEALDMLQAMNTGHDGSLTTVHANTPRDVISRLETMVLMSGMDLPVRAIREQVAAAVDMIVHESRFSDGSRKVTNITEVVGLEGDQITMQDIFEFVQTGVDEAGKVLGSFRPTGSVPTFMDEVSARGLTINRAMFNPGVGGD